MALCLGSISAYLGSPVVMARLNGQPLELHLRHNIWYLYSRRLEQTFESGAFTANLYTNSRMDIFHNGEMWHMVFYVGCERTAEDEFKYQIGEDDDAPYGITDVVLEMAKLVPFPKEGASR